MQDASLKAIDREESFRFRCEVATLMTRLPRHQEAARHINVFIGRRIACLKLLLQVAGRDEIGIR